VWQQDVGDYYKGVDFDIAIAPSADQLFNRSKTWIRALEMGALGIPIVAQNRLPYSDYVIDGVTGFLVNTEEEWHDRLTELINDPEMRAEMGGPPLSAVAPVAPPAAARTYLVFFDWDRADLTDRARQVVGDAVQGAKRVSNTRIEVAGHADRSGTPAYNQALSQRRAESVGAELVRQGINRSDIIVTAFGESRPLVPTADNVREPQNRRVEIVLR
jgi:outer membrane protein OmpA-like peptidoglycan-associated protein